MKKTLKYLKWLFILFVISGITWGVWYTHQVGVSGFTGKTLWDWMELLIVPGVLALGAWWLNKNEKQTEREIATKREQNERELALDRQRQNALEAYFDRMTDLLLEQGLRDSKEGDEVRIIARTQTLTVLRQLDENRRGQLLRFLYEAGLISLDRKIDLSTSDFSSVELSGVDLSQIDLSGVNLVKANFRQANLSNANLSEANFSEAILTDATLTDALLTGSTLDNADLTFANLDRAILYMANLQHANLRKASLKKANLNRANFSHAILRGAKFEDADIGQANFESVDLRGLTESDEVELRESGVIGPFSTEKLLMPAQITKDQLDSVKSLEHAILPGSNKSETIK